MPTIVDDLICDPADFEPDRTELSLSSAGLKVLDADFGEAAIEASMARQELGETVTDRHLPNKEMIFKLGVRSEGVTDLPTVAAQLQQKVGLWQREGGWLQRNFIYEAGGKFAGSLACQVKKATLADFAGWQRGESPDVTLALVTGPLWYAVTEQESSVIESAGGARELIFELASVLGTAPGLIRVRVKNLGGADWRGLILAGESRDHPQDATKDTTAALAYDAVDLTPLGEAAEAEREGVKVIRHAKLTAGWLAILDSEITAGVLGHMTHRGVRRLWTRIWDPGEEAGNVQLKLRWRALGAVAWSEDNAIVPTPLVGDWALIDLGEVRPQLATVGDERWEFQVQARAVSGSGAIDLQRHYPLPTEQFAVVRTPGVAQAADLQSQKSPGTVESVKAEKAGEPSWSTPENAKASDDNRATLKEAAAFDNQFLKATNFGFALPEGAAIQGIIVEVERSQTAGEGGTGFGDYEARIVKGGSIGSTDRIRNEYWPLSDVRVPYGASNDPWGETWSASEINAAGFGFAIRVVHSTVFETSREARVDHIRITAYYTEAADPNRICFATRSIGLRSDGVIRQHPEDDVWGVVIPESFLPYASPSGLEGRASRFIVIPSQGDLGELADSGSNKLSTQVFDRAGYLFAREAA